MRSNFRYTTTSLPLGIVLWQKQMGLKLKPQDGNLDLSALRFGNLWGNSSAFENQVSMEKVGFLA